MTKTYSWKIYKDVPGVEYWYDRRTRAWYAASVDANGNLRESVDAYTKREIKLIAEEIGARTGLKPGTCKGLAMRQFTREVLQL